MKKCGNPDMRSMYPYFHYIDSKERSYTQNDIRQHEQNIPELVKSHIVYLNTRKDFESKGHIQREKE